MALGRPVIASGVGGVLSVIEDGRTGLIVPPSDSRSLAERMIELLTNPDLARRLGEAGRQRIHDQFNEQRMLNDVIQLYNEVNTAVGRRSVTIPITAAPRGS